MQISRRKLVSGLTVAGLSLYSKKANSGSSKIRYGSSTEKGREALVLYRKAVRELTGRPHDRTGSWRFLANVHAYPSSEPIDEIFSTDALPENEKIAVNRRRALALGGIVDGQNFPGVWRTCPHTFADINYHFLPWHRAYLLMLEGVIERILGAPFAIPYWDYTVKPFLPVEFREAVEGSTANNPLFYSERLINENGELPPALVDASSPLSQSQFGFRDATALGFSLDIEANLHGNIHVETGTSLGMADPRYAARDPIFYLHHAAIDRLWASWHISFSDPTDSEWLQAKHIFVAEDDNIATWTTADLLSTEQLGYTYDSLEKVEMVSSNLIPFSVDGVTEIARSQEVQISASAKVVEMKPSLVPLDASLRRNDARFVLLFEGIRVERNPATSYLVYVNPPKDATSNIQSERFAGRFNLFAAGLNHEGHTEIGNAVIDVTHLVRNGLVDLARLDTLSLSIIPARAPRSAVNIRSITLVGR